MGNAETLKGFFPLKDTAIEYCDSTNNAEIGCMGCELWSADGKIRTCYAGQLVSRYAGTSSGYPAAFDKPQLFLKRLIESAKWPDLRGKDRPGKPWLNGLPRFIFLNDLGDTFTEGLPHDWLGLPSNELAGCSPLQVLAQHKAIIMLLTKRATQMRQFFERYECPHNFIVMTSITGPDTLNRVRELLKIKGARWRGLSAEPLIVHAGKANWWRGLEEYLPGLAWIATGAESGAGKRQYELQCFRDLRDMCAKHGTRFFMKQLDKVATIPADLMVRQLPDFTL